jgi:hypothetical protein
VSNKAEKRLAKRRAKSEGEKAKIVARLDRIPEVPLVRSPPGDKSLRPQVGIDPAALKAPQKPRSRVDGEASDALITWCVSKKDIVGHWSWNQARAWTEDEWEKVIEPKLLDFAKMRWPEVLNASANGRVLHHFQALDSIVGEARRRWTNDLGLLDFADGLFRFRLSNKRRLWGYVLQDHFFTVWWDRSHKIFPVG